MFAGKIHCLSEVRENLASFQIFEQQLASIYVFLHMFWYNKYECKCNQWLWSNGHFFISSASKFSHLADALIQIDLQKSTNRGNTARLVERNLVPPEK